MSGCRDPEQLKQATGEVEDWMDALDPAATKAGGTTDLGSIADAADSVKQRVNASHATDTQPAEYASS